MTSSTPHRLYPHSPSTLIPLLRSQLPHTIVVLATILASRRDDAEGVLSIHDDVPYPPSLDPVYASFPPTADGSDVTVEALYDAGVGQFEWLVTVALPQPSEQIRVHHAYVAAPPEKQSPETKQAADAMVEYAIREMAQRYPAQLVVGYTHETFEEVTRRVVGGGERTRTYTYVAPGLGWGHTDIDLGSVNDSWRSELLLDHGRPGDAPVIFETNRYRREAYYALRGAYTTCLRLSDSSACEVWVMTHGDGSLGALWTQPTFRRRGLAKVVLANHLAKAEAQGIPSFCYIEDGNTASMKLFESLGWRPLPWVTYWVYEHSVADEY